jgi:lipopolysaccharide/colanic/teichoic acid biosynthesis glycosyltransferase
MKRGFDIVLASLALACAAPVIALGMLLVWLYDGDPALYRAPRVGRGGRDFSMIKLRTMVIDAERFGAASTKRDDERITPIGHVLRRTKLDELPQFWNVLRGEMSIVGPRPNSRRGGVDRYTPAELRLLSVRPGITDLASIVFADEADILAGSDDPDARYDTVIRPWKSRLGLLYIDRRSLDADLTIVALTGLSLVGRRLALAGVARLLVKWGAEADLRRACSRRDLLANGGNLRSAA